MMVSRCGLRVLLAVGFVAYCGQVYAQPPQDAASAQAIRSEIEQLKQDFDARLSALESRLANLEGRQPASAEPASPTPQTAAAAAPPAADGSLAASNAGAASSAKFFNPDMAVIGNFLGAAGKNEVNPIPALALQESEVSMQAVVDPYARADFFLSFGEEGVAVEEGYLTFPALPGGLLMKVGRQYAAFGKANTLHAHVLPWADRPLVSTNLLGGDEPMADAGISVARLIPNPWLFLEATGQVFRGDGGVFHSSQRSDLSYVGHVRGYHDISESTNVDLGASYAYGHNTSGVVNDIDLGRFTTSLFGVDATVRWKPLQRAIYHSFVGRGEAIWSRKGQPLDGRQNASGFYVSGDYQVGRRWFTGVRVDRSARPDNSDARDTGQSWVLTYMPSEFSQVRGQLRRTKYAEGETANEVLFQFQFAIGAHGAHPF